MATAYMLFERRLQELEFQLHHPSTETPTDVEHDTDMQRKFAFLRTFLAAEIESYDGDKPDHLRELSDRLDMLEEAYSKGRIAPGSDVVDAISSCSCTETCVEGEKEEEEVVEKVEEKVVLKRSWKWLWLIGVAVVVGAVAVAVVVANVKEKLPYLVPT